jgi:hypothetical protein
MAITSPAAKAYSNQRARVTANLVEKAVRTIDQFLVETVDYLAIPEVAALFAEYINVATTQLRKDEIAAEVISDDAASDGRPIATFGKILELKYTLEQLQNAINVGDLRQLLSKLASDSTPIF